MREVGLHAILVDNYLKKKIPLSIADSSFIEFTVDTNSESYENRFMVLFERVSTTEYSAAKNELFKTGSFVVTPNPTENNTISIQFSNQSIGKYKIHLINNSGQIVFNRSIKVKEANGKDSIMPGIIASGSYQLVIIAEDERKSVQQVIIK